MNPSVELEQSTPKVKLHIFSEFQKDFGGNTTVSMVNSWLELYQSTRNIYADFAIGLTECTRVTGVNSWVELF